MEDYRTTTVTIDCYLTPLNMYVFESELKYIYIYIYGCMFCMLYDFLVLPGASAIINGNMSDVV